MDAMFGRLLDVDLTRDRIGEYKVPDRWVEAYLGGKGLAARVLLEEYRGGDPLGPDNPLVYMTGPLVGLLVGGSGRHLVATHSPLTGFFGEAYCGGFFGSELKRTGWDGIVFRGRADHPVYLTINGGPEIHDAAALWGKTVGETEDAIRAGHGKDVRVSCIGPAGENLVRFAAIMNDRNRANARCGVGAVMGSKNLKAVAVKGHVNPPVRDPKRFNEIRREWTKTLMTEDMKHFGQYGTAGGVDTLHEMGILPTKNFQAGQFDGHERISGETMVHTVLVDRDTCTACPVSCKREVEVEVDGRTVTREYGGPEYETIAAFGSFQMNDRLDAISLANQLCNAYGLDTISTGNVIAWAMEASERGLIPEPVRWGDARRACELIKAIAYRRGLGDALAEGVARAAKAFGGEAFAMHVKGLEVPMHEPRGKKGLGLSYAVSPRGASHMEGFHDTMIAKKGSPELGVAGKMDRFSVEGKAEVAKRFEDARSFVNCQILCVFDVTPTDPGYNLHLVRDMVNAAMGSDFRVEDMLTIGERAYNLARLFAVRMGARADHDDLPPRFKEQALPYGDRRERMSPEELARLKSEYYAARGWDASGRPTPERLRTIGVDLAA